MLYLVEKLSVKTRSDGQMLALLLKEMAARCRIKLNALPLQNENGEVWLSLFEQKPKGNADAFNRAAEDILDDEIPI